MISPDIPSDMKRCGGPCGLVLELEAFNRHPHCIKGRQPKCKKCVAAAYKELQALRDERKRAAAPIGRMGEIPSFGSHPLHEEHNDTPADTPVFVQVTGPGRTIPAKNPAPPDQEVRTRLELATAILDQIANGRDERLGEFIGQARRFVTVERGAMRYIRNLIL
jgi:hypothetical protein